MRGMQNTRNGSVILDGSNNSNNMGNQTVQLPFKRKERRNECMSK